MAFVNNHGSEISSEEFEVWAKEAESGDFSRWEPVGKPNFGSYLGDTSEASTMTFVCPMTLKLQIGDEAKRLQCTDGDLLRMLVSEGLKNLA